MVSIPPAQRTGHGVEVRLLLAGRVHEVRVLLLADRRGGLQVLVRPSDQQRRAANKVSRQRKESGCLSVLGYPSWGARSRHEPTEARGPGRGRAGLWPYIAERD